MGISVQHSEPTGQLSGIVTAIGQGRSADKQTQLNEERARFILGLRERRREVDVNAALRVREQDIQQRQYQQNLAQQSATQQQIAYNQEANRQAQLYSQQMREEYGLAQQQQEQMFQYAADAVKTTDEQVRDTVKEAQQLKLNPEGQRLLNEKMGRLRELQQYSATMRPEVYDSVLRQWQADYQSAGIDAYVEQEPTAAEKVYEGLVPLQGEQIVPRQALPPGTYRSLKGNRNGVEQWETITIPEPVSPTFAEDVNKNTAPAPDGGFFLRQPDGKFTHVPPVKPEKPAAVKKPDFGKYISQATTDLVNEYASKHPDDKTTHVPESSAVKERARKHWQLEQELAAELEKESEADNPSMLQPLAIPGIGGGIASGLSGMMMDAVSIDSQEEYDALPSGAVYIDAQTGARGSKP